MNSALLSLRTRNGANHAQHNITHDLGGSLGRELNGAAPLVIKSTRQRRLAHHEQHAMVHGAHIVATLVPRHWEHLWAGTLDVSQPLLDADMERHQSCAWLGRVKCAPPQAAAAAHVPIAGYAHLNGQLSAQLSVGDLGYEIPWICTIHTHP